MKRAQMHDQDDEYTKDLERGVRVLSEKLSLLREQHRRVLLSMLLSSNGRIIVPEMVLFDLNPKDTIAEHRDPITGDYVYTVVIHPRK